MSSSQTLTASQDVSLAAERNRLIGELAEVEALMLDVPATPKTKRVPFPHGPLSTSLTVLALGREMQEASMRQCLLTIGHGECHLEAFLRAPDQGTLEFKARIRYRYVWSMIPRSDRVLCNISFGSCFVFESEIADETLVVHLTDGIGKAAGVQVDKEWADKAHEGYLRVLVHNAAWWAHPDSQAALREFWYWSSSHLTPLERLQHITNIRRAHALPVLDYSECMGGRYSGLALSREVKWECDTYEFTLVEMKAPDTPLSICNLAFYDVKAW